MSTSLAGRLDEHVGWRQALGAGVADFSRYLAAHDLFDIGVQDGLAGLQRQLAADTLSLAFVAEFSRGKSELINALFFADLGRRVLPATPGRTTMCPVEIGWDASGPPSLALLPIETRLEARSLAEWRHQGSAWQRTLLDTGAPEQIARALSQVTRTQRVSIDQARALGLWHDDTPDDNPPAEDGSVEIPLWRHALIQYPHPLLERGLVVLDTPGLNAIGAEPELTLGLLPSAHATVFVLAADTGVTKSDLAVWREHLHVQQRSRFVALNKIDALADPLATPAVVQEQIEQQRQRTARTLGIGVEQVFPISARQALMGRISDDGALLDESRVPLLEAALVDSLLPHRRDVLEQSVAEALSRFEVQWQRKQNDQRRQIAEQMLELRGLRGKSGSKLGLMLQRIDAEVAEFEQCTSRLRALRSVHGRMLREAMAEVSTAHVHDGVADLKARLSASLLKLGARSAFQQLCGQLRARVEAAARRAEEIKTMLEASFLRLNADYGFSLALPAAPAFAGAVGELGRIENNYEQYLGLRQALRLAQPAFREQFTRMLASRVAEVFDNVGSEIDGWNKNASAQVDAQLRERRRGFKRRRESLERVQTAASELEQRIVELEAQETRGRQLERDVAAHLAGLRQLMSAAVIAETASVPSPSGRAATEAGPPRASRRRARA